LMHHFGARCLNLVRALTGLASIVCLACGAVLRHQKVHFFIWSVERASSPAAKESSRLKTIS